jgi:WD40 repeat protein
VIFTVRDDFLGRLAIGPETRAVLSQVTVVQSLDASALEDVLRKPVRAVGYDYDDPTLVAEMVASVQHERAALPLLQFAAQTLWERRDKAQRLLLRSAYERMGGVAGALARHADGVLDHASAEELELTRALLLRLVTPERTRKVVAKDKALAGLGEQAEQVLGKLTAARLLTTTRLRGRAAAEASLELAHESLVHTWGTLARWIDESREELAFLSEASHAAERWSRHGRRLEDLWRGDALRDATRRLARLSPELPELVAEFLAHGREQEQRRGSRRRRLFGSAIGLLTLVALGALTAALLVADRERRARDAKRQADEQRAVAEQQRAAALREGARAALAQGDVLEARAKLRASLEAQDSPLGRALWWQLAADPREWTRRLGAVVYDVAYAPDGQSVAAAASDGVVHLFDVATGRARLLRAGTTHLLAVAYARDGRLLATGGMDGSVRLWETATGRQAGELRGHRGSVWAVSFSPDGTMLASSGADRSVRTWDLGRRKQRLLLTGHGAEVRAVSFAPSGPLLASGGGDGTVRLWDAATGREQRVLRGHQAPLRAVAFSPDGARLASSGHDRTVLVWDVATGAERLRLVGHGASVQTVGFSPDGRFLASGSADKSIRLWDATRGSLLRQLGGHEGTVWGLAFAPDGKRLVSGGFDFSVRLWSLGRQPGAERRHGHDRAVAFVTIGPDGQRAASGGFDGLVLVWDLATGEPLHVLSGHSGPVERVAFSPDGSLLASASRDYSVRLWDSATGAERTVLPGHGNDAVSVAFGPDGKLLASGSLDQTVRLWSVPGGEPVAVLAAHAGPVVDVAFSPDGKRLAAAGYDGVIRLWDVAGRRPERTLAGHADQVADVAFSPDGRRLASAGWDGRALLWDVRTGRSTELARFRDSVDRVAFAPDGRLLGWVRDGGPGQLFDLGARRRLDLEGWRRYGEEGLASFTLSPDGRLLLATDGPSVRLWDAVTRRPRWRGPALLDAPPRLLSHRGWERLDRHAPAPLPDSAWRRALEERARLAHVAAAGATLLCLEGLDGRVELWDLAADRPLVERRFEPLAQVLALPEGCAARSGGRVTLLARSGAVQPITLAPAPEAMGVGEAELLVAAGGTIHLFDRQGRPLGRRPAAEGITALAGQGDLVVAGYRDGSIELVPLRAGSDKMAMVFEQVPASPVRRLLGGPMGTVVAGYDDGTLGIWSLHDGARLRQTRLHGAVVHLLLEGQRLFAATDLGSHETWDLSGFHRDHCELLRELWREVPIEWKDGAPALSPPPADHPCRKR